MSHKQHQSTSKHAAIQSTFTVKEQHLSWRDYLSEDINPTPRLPLEIQIRIISHLDYESLDKAGEVCHAWRVTSLDQRLWYQQMKLSFGIPSHARSFPSSAKWRAAVKRTHFKYKCMTDAEKMDASLEMEHFTLSSRLAITNPSLLTNDVLYSAAQYGHLRVAELAIQHGANVHYESADGSTPLYVAAQEGYSKLVQLLIANGAKTEIVFRDGYTPLYIAAQNGRLAVVKCLLAMGASIDAKCTHGSTPLYIACQQGQTKVVRLLVESGASAELLFKKFTCLYVAARNGHHKILAFLLTRFHDMIEMREGDGSSALFVASQNGHAKCVKLLIDAHANTEATFLNDYRPLYIAAQDGQAEAVDALCVGGAVIDAFNVSGTTALYVAARWGHLDCVKSLLTHGASVNLAANMNRYTALYVAAQRNHFGVCEALLDHGAHIDLVFDVMFTPLYIACLKGHIGIVRLLLSRGASVNGIINSDKVPLHAAMEENHLAVCKVLLDHGAEVNLDSMAVRLHDACLKGRIEIVKLILSCSVSVNGNHSDKVPLHAAMQGNHIAIITLLIRAGAATEEIDTIKCKSSTFEYTHSLIAGLKEWDS